MKVNEIFYSIQGEGYYTGTPALFIRFSGCNLKCAFCDTEHEAGTEMTVDEIVSEAASCPARHVVLTGGEPGLQITDELVEKLHRAGKYVQVETNGTCHLPEGIDWITCSPKEGGRLRVERPHEVKVVYTGQDLSVYEAMPANVHCLQPCSGQNTDEVIRYIMEHPTWRLSLQVHKILNVR